MSIQDIEVTSSAKSEVFEQDFCKYDPHITNPNPYNEDDSFCSQPFELEKQTQLHANMPQTTNVKTIVYMDGMRRIDSTVCGWCCHSFENDFIGLPMKYFNSKFYVTGCFCSFECACADNFYSNEGNLSVWETYNLLNLMAKKIKYTSAVYPAPPRKCLKMFGGYMDICAFRNFRTTSKILATNHFPQVSVVEQIEEINDFYHKSKEIFTFDSSRLDRYEEKILNESGTRLHENFKNTLDSTMSISTY